MPREIKNRALKFSVMLAHKYDKLRIHNWNHIFVEPKLDGIRVIIVADPKKEAVAFYSRNGRQLLMFAHLHKEVLRFVGRAALYDDRFERGAILDGEMTSESESFGAISGAIHRNNHTAFDARFACFAALPAEQFFKGEDDVPQFKRAKMIERICRRLEFISHHSAVQAFDHEEVMDAWKAHEKDGYEGSMVKDYSKPWIGMRTHTWMKLKPEETYDVVITGVKAGKGKYEGSLGALRYQYQGKDCSTSGMTDQERDDWWKLHKKGKLVGRMVEVKCAGVTEKGSLRHPRFIRFRDDKQEVA
jgi:DNA ligase-1